ncbi:MAG: hypothetical protein JNN27_07275 [Planctomycetes bacterium]|jgi:hypothetical protein|nr:hypothetical protein [Planctomycetota bacterium]
MRNALLIALLALPLSSCLVAGAVGGVVLSSEMMDNRTHRSHLNQDARVVWNTVKDFLAKESPELIEFDDQTRIASAKLDGRVVRVEVQAFDVDQSTMTVSAKNYMATVNDGEFAEIISERLIRRLNAQK